MPPVPAIPTALPIPTVSPELVVVDAGVFWDVGNWEFMISIAQTMINLVQMNFYNIIIIVLIIEIIAVAISVGRKRSGEKSLAAIEHRIERQTGEAAALADAQQRQYQNEGRK